MMSTISNKQSNPEAIKIGIDGNSGIKVINKKLISFRSTSKSGDKKQDFQNSNKYKHNNNNTYHTNPAKVKMNQTQPFNQALH